MSCKTRSPSACAIVDVGERVTNDDPLQFFVPLPIGQHAEHRAQRAPFPHHHALGDVEVAQVGREDDRVDERRKRFSDEVRDLMTCGD